MTLTCPACHKALEEFRFHQSEVDICASGCGVWFDGGELQDVEQSETLAAIDEAFPGVYTKKALNEAMADGPRNCLRHIEQLMSRYQWNIGSGLVFDKCAVCDGMWLDAGELEGYAMFIKKFRDNPPTMTPELQARLDAAKATTGERLSRHLNGVTEKVVDWDFGLLDDAIRGLMKVFTR